MKTFSYNTGSPNTVNRQTFVDGVTVVATAEFEGDWRYNRQVVDSLENKVVFIDETGANKVITTYDANVSLSNDLDFNKEALDTYANRTTLEYDSNGNLVGGSVSYKEGNKMSTMLGVGLTGDTIKLDNGFDYSFTIKDGQLVSNDPAVVIIGTYTNVVDGIENTGRIENGTLVLNEQGLVGVSGKVDIDDGKSFDLLKGTGGEKDENAPIPDASDT